MNRRVEFEDTVIVCADIQRFMEFWICPNVALMNVNGTRRYYPNNASQHVLYNIRNGRNYLCKYTYFSYISQKSVTNIKKKETSRKYIPTIYRYIFRVIKNCTKQFEKNLTSCYLRFQHYLFNLSNNHFRLPSSCLSSPYHAPPRYKSSIPFKFLDDNTPILISRKTFYFTETQIVLSMARKKEQNKEKAKRTCSK